MSAAGAAAARIKAPTLTEQAVAALRERIVTNQLPAGSTHLETELAEMLGMSRTPVREATLILAGQGLVEIRPRRGVRVRPLAARDMEEIYAILTELEALAAHDVAASRPGPAAMAELRGAIAAMEAALAPPEDRRAWAAADDAFHRRLIALSGNRRLEEVVATYWDQVRRARLLTLTLRPAPHRSNEEHRALVEAIAAGDADAARALHRAHRIAAKTLLIELITTHGLTIV